MIFAVVDITVKLGARVLVSLFLLTLPLSPCARNRLGNYKTIDTFAGGRPADALQIRRKQRTIKGLAPPTHVIDVTFSFVTDSGGYRLLVVCPYPFCCCCCRRCIFSLTLYAPGYLHAAAIKLTVIPTETFLYIAFRTQYYVLYSSVGCPSSSSSSSVIYMQGRTIGSWGLHGTPSETDRPHACTHR